jgi:exosortase
VPSQTQSELFKSSLSEYQRSWLMFGAWVVVCSLLYLKPLFSLFTLALSNDDASHVLIVPFIAAWLFYIERRKFSHPELDLKVSLLLLIPASGLATAILLRSPDPSIAFPDLIFCFLLFVVSGFVATFGIRCFRSEWFPLAFLGFVFPFPEHLLNYLIYLLQAGSASIAERIFDWTNVPALREGFVFRLPRISIEVAKECSGIRSSFALLILAVLVAHFSFSKFWKKAAFVAAGLLMMIVKNGVRIATLTILANNVNPDFLYGRLHREGGVVFFLLGLGLLLPVYWFLRRGEMPISASAARPSL